MVNTFALSRRALAIIAAALFTLALMMPVLGIQRAEAAQLTSRKVTISSSESAQTGVTWAFSFVYPTGSDAVSQGIIFEYCTTALGTCTVPTGLDITSATASVGAQSFEEATNFTEVTATTGDCTKTGTAATESKFCVSRTDTDTEDANGGTPKTIEITGVTNPSLPGQAPSYSTVYVRMSVYNNDTFTPGAGGANIVQYGTVAAAITQQLTTQGRVQERLEFCVAAIDDGGATDTTLPTSCGTAPTTTTVDLGVIDNASIVKSPVDGTATNPANDFYGIAMVNTNAAGGVVVTYYPEMETSVAGGDTDQLYAFRVAATDCNATVTVETDQCFVSASNAGEQFTVGSEKFGLYVPCIDNFTVSPTRSTTSNLAITAAYLGDTSTSAADCENVANDNFAWNASATATSIASSTTVVDDEIIKLSFGATAGSTTPTGLYRVTTTYIATPTF